MLECMCDECENTFCVTLHVDFSPNFCCYCGAEFEPPTDEEKAEIFAMHDEAEERFSCVVRAWDIAATSAVALAIGLLVFTLVFYLVYGRLP